MPSIKVALTDTITTRNLEIVVKFFVQTIINLTWKLFIIRFKLIVSIIDQIIEGNTAGLHSQDGRDNDTTPAAGQHRHLLPSPERQHHGDHEEHPHLDGGGHQGGSDLLHPLLERQGVGRGFVQ